MEGLLELIKVIYKILGISFADAPIFITDKKYGTSFVTNHKTNSRHIVVSVEHESSSILEILGIAHTCYLAYADLHGRWYNPDKYFDGKELSKDRFKERVEQEASNFSLLFVCPIIKHLLKDNDSEVLKRSYEDFSKPFDITGYGFDKITEMSIQNELNDVYDELKNDFEGIINHYLEDFFESVKLS